MKVLLAGGRAVVVVALALPLDARRPFRSWRKSVATAPPANPSVRLTMMAIAGRRLFT